MNKRTYNNFELLLFAASELCVEKDAADFLAIDTSNVTISPKCLKQIERQIYRNRPHRTTWSVIKIACVACLLCLSVAFTACMCVPKIREAIRNVIVEWYDDYIAIDFPDIPITETVTETTAPEPDTTTSEPETSPTKTVQVPPPTTIEAKAYAAYLPEGYYGEEFGSSNTFCCLNYYKSDGTMAFTLIQSTIKDELRWVDGEDVTIEEININHNKALFVIKESMPDVSFLLWQDGFYEYNLYGNFSSFEEMKTIAESLQLKSEQ